MLFVSAAKENRIWVTWVFEKRENRAAESITVELLTKELPSFYLA